MESLFDRAKRNEDEDEIEADHNEIIDLSMDGATKDKENAIVPESNFLENNHISIMRHVN